MKLVRRLAMERMYINIETHVWFQEGMEEGASPGSEGDLLDKNLVIAEEVVAALAEDPRTASSVIEVVFERGVITLMGQVEGELAHTAAEEIAHCHEGVVSVVNALEVRPGPRNLDNVASVLGQLFTLDRVQ
jgi:osmotically-inducible protein OsmY